MDTQHSEKARRSLSSSERYDELYALYVKHMNNDDAECMVNAGTAALLSDPASDTAARHFSQAANLGSAISVYKLGQCYEYGFGAETDEKKAEELYIKSGDMGYTPGYLSAAELYIRNKSLNDIDYKRAFEFYLKAANSGDTDAELQTAFFYEYGIGAEANPLEAYKLCTSAAGKGNVMAIYTLGKYLERGVGLPPDDESAYARYEQAAAEKNPQAMAQLHMKYPEREITKTAAAYERSYKAAHADLIKIYGEDKVITSYSDAINGDTTALLIQGILADALKHQSRRSGKEAFYLLSKSAKAGNPTALWYTANCYLAGRYVKRNADEAFKLFSAAYIKGNVPSMWSLGLCYEFGFGTEADAVKALEFYTKAHEAGYSPATATLAGLYETGCLTDEDFDRSKELYAKLNDSRSISEPWAELHSFFYDRLPFSDTRIKYRICRFEELRGLDHDRYFGMFRALADEGCVQAMLRICDMYSHNTDSTALLEKALLMCERAAAENYPPAIKRLEQFHTEHPAILAKRYEMQDSEADRKKAFEYYLRAAQQGDPQAMQRIQVYYSDGKYIEPDLCEAYKWECRYRAAGNDSNTVYEWHYPEVLSEAQCAEYCKAHTDKAAALYSLGVCYETGYGVARDEAKAAELYMQASARDYRWAHYALARCYDKGCGTEQDTAKAQKLYLTALTERDPIAIKYFSGNIAGLQADNNCMKCIIGICLENGYGTGRNEKAAYELYTQAAENNCAEALYLLGRCYERARGVTVNIKKAFELYARAAKAHYAPAMCALGEIFEIKNASPENLKKALTWYKAASDMPYHYATYKLGSCISNIDPERARSYFTTSANSEIAEAQVELGKLLEQEGSTDEALKMYNKAANSGNSDAHLALGRFYMKSDDKSLDKKVTDHLQRASDMGNPEAAMALAKCYADGSFTNKSAARAAQLYEIAARSGNAEAQYRLGRLYEQGSGVKQSYEKAFSYYSHAAESDHSDAQYALGLLYSKGKGTEQNASLAVYMYSRATENGNDRAATALGICYENGQGGLSVDTKRALELYMLAADKGNYIAQYRLGLCYERGIAVAADLEEAFKWYKLSAEAGNALAQLKLGECYENGCGTDKDMKSALASYELATKNGSGEASARLAKCYEYGYGVNADKKKAEYWRRRANELGYVVSKGSGRFLGKRKSNGR